MTRDVPARVALAIHGVGRAVHRGNRVLRPGDSASKDECHAVSFEGNIQDPHALSGGIIQPNLKQCRRRGGVLLGQHRGGLQLRYCAGGVLCLPFQATAEVGHLEARSIRRAGKDVPCARRERIRADRCRWRNQRIGVFREVHRNRAHAPIALHHVVDAVCRNFDRLRKAIGQGIRWSRL